MSGVADALTGRKLAEIRSRSDRCALSVAAEKTVVFSVDSSGDEPKLAAEVGEPVEGDRLFEDGTGRKIVRVVEDAATASLHLDDGTIFHVLAVRNEDGIRLATREEREHARAPRSWLDKVLGRVR